MSNTATTTTHVSNAELAAGKVHHVHKNDILNIQQALNQIDVILSTPRNVYSTTLNAYINTSTLVNLIDELIAAHTVNANATLSIDDIEHIYEYGTPISNISGSITTISSKNPGILYSTYSIEHDGVPIISDQPVTHTDGGIEPFDTVCNITDGDIVASFKDVNDNIIVSNTQSFKYVYPILTLSSVDSDKDAQSIYDGVGISDKHIIEKRDFTITYNISDDDYIYVAYPATYGDLAEIVDTSGNVFNISQDWEKSTGDIIGLDTTTQAYTVYKFKHALSQGNVTINYKF
jgi:predicted nucleic acid-binding protein